MFGVQLYKNNARALLSRILSILNLDWLQHARSVRGVYELTNNQFVSYALLSLAGSMYLPGLCFKQLNYRKNRKQVSFCVFLSFSFFTLAHLK